MVALAGGEAFAEPLVRNGADPGRSYLVAGGQVPPSALHDDLAQLRTILLAGWGVVVALSAAAGALVARRVLRPVAQASEAARSLAEGLLETRLPVDADDEFGAWATSFNEMAEALEEKIRALSERERTAARRLDRRVERARIRIALHACYGGYGTWSPDSSRVVCSGHDLVYDNGPLYKGFVTVVDVATGLVSGAAEGKRAIWLDDHTLLVEV
jgi:HAMP domain-containing protein